MPQNRSFNCPVEAALAVIGGKWKILILCRLHEGVSRFNELRSDISGISQRVLTQQLRELEGDGIVSRVAYPDGSPRVEYALTELGRSLEPVIDRLGAWGQHYEEVLRPAAPAPRKILQSA